MDAFITIRVKAVNLVEPEDLEDWDEQGNSITLQEYVRFMIQENMFFDLVGDFNKLELINVEEIQ